MKEKKVRLIVSMPGKVVMDESVEMVILTAVEGNIGILPGHEPCSIALRSGVLRVRREGREGRDSRSEVALMVMGGFATVQDSGDGGGSGRGVDGDGGIGGEGSDERSGDGGGEGSGDGGRSSVVNVVTPVADTPERIEQAINAIMKEREQNIKYEQTANLEINRAEMALRNILLRRDDSMFSFPKGWTGNKEGSN